MSKKYILDLFINNKEEIITSSYMLDKDSYNYRKNLFSFRKVVEGYELRVIGINRDFKIDGSLYSKLNKYDGKIRIVYWENSGLVDKIEFVDEVIS